MLKKRMDSFGYALKGIRSAFVTEAHIKIQFLMAVLVFAAAFYFNVSVTEWGLLIICISLVLTSELFNTAVEKIMDHVSPEHHPVVGYIKDISAGAVLISAIGSAIIGLIIFLPRVFNLFN